MFEWLKKRKLCSRANLVGLADEAHVKIGAPKISSLLQVCFKEILRLHMIQQAT